MNCQLVESAFRPKRSRVKVIASAVDTIRALALAKETEPDIVVISAHLREGPLEGYRLLRALRSLQSNVRAIMLLDSREPDSVVDAFRCGAHGVVFRDEPLEILGKCIRAVYQGQVWANSLHLRYLVDALGQSLPMRLQDARGIELLSKREEDVVRLLAQGLTNKDISAELGLSQHTLSNNHAYDFGPRGVEQTRYAVIRRDMVPLGAGYSLQDAPEIFIWKGPNNLRVGFWAAAKASCDVAKRNSPGVEPATLERAGHALAEMKNQGAQFCIALLHCGVIRTNRPDPEDVALLDSLAGIGFNIVAASHSHRISGSRIIQRGKQPPSFCFYGLGSLVSGYVAHPLEREGLVVVAGLDARGRLTCLQLKPVWLGATGFGEIPTPNVSRTILDRFRTLSTELADDSYRRRFYHDVSPGLLGLYVRDALSAFRQQGLRGVVHKASRIRMRHIRRLWHEALV